MVKKKAKKKVKKKAKKQPGNNKPEYEKATGLRYSTGPVQVEK